MPQWFMTLGYICLTVMMVCFLVGISGAIIYIAIVLCRDWKDEHDLKRSLKRFEGRSDR